MISIKFFVSCALLVSTQRWVKRNAQLAQKEDTLHQKVRAHATTALEERSYLQEQEYQYAQDVRHVLTDHIGASEILTIRALLVMVIRAGEQIRQKVSTIRRLGTALAATQKCGSQTILGYQTLTRLQMIVSSATMV
jgi:hypothetical protein